MNDTYLIRNGWISGELPGPNGLIEVRRDESPPFPPRAEVKPNLVLHTTETDSIGSWEFPPHFTVGEGIVVQNRPLWAKAESLRGDTTNDPYALQVEIVGHSKLAKWLPPKPSLDPLVALVATLEREHLIRSGLKRPTTVWPIVLDRLPAAIEDYYRRQARLWPSTAGVYGHVEIPGNTHWDPGSFDYPEFFSMVSSLLEGGDDEMSFSDWQLGTEDYRQGKPLDEEWMQDRKKGWRFAKWADRPGASGEHIHVVTGTAGTVS